MRIGKKLTLGYVLVALLVAVVGFLGLNAIRAISHPFDDVSRHSVPTIQTVEGLRFAGLKIVSSTSEWALMRSESEARILQRKTTNDKGQKPEAEEEEQIQSGRHMYDALLKRYEELLQDEKETSEGKVLLERIRISGQQLQNNSAKLIELKKARVAGQAILEKKEDLEIAEKDFLDAVDAAIRLENSEVVSDIATVESRIKTAINTISACGVLTLIVALVTGVWMAGSISKPLTRMKRASAEIGKGKLDSRLKVNSSDEIGELADAFNRMAADLKRSNTEIVSAKNFAANIVRSMADTLIVADTRLFITRVNQATLSLLGYEEHELIGKPLETVVADLVFGDAGIDELKEADFSSGAEKTYTRKDGAKVPMLFSGSVLKDEDCEVQGIVCVAHSIAERKQIDDALRRSEEHFRSLIENASDVITIIDARGTILYESPSVERVLGLKPQTLMGANALGLTHPDDRKTAVALLTAAIGEDGTAGPTEVRFEHADGSWRTLEVIGQVVRDESGAVEVIINSRDVTERKRSDAALRESEEKYRTILESIQEGYYEVDLRGHLTFFNDSLCRIVGTPADKLMGLNHREYTDPNTARMVFEAFNRVFSSGKPIEGLQYQIIDLDGVTRFLELSVSLRRESTGEIAGFRGTIRDVTERVQAEQALRESEERYKTLFESATDSIMVLATEEGRRGRILAANRAAAEHTGYTVEELLDLNLVDLQTQGQTELTSREFQRIVQGESVSVERLRVRKDGSTFPIEVNAGPLKLGAKTYILSFARDLTQRKQIEKEATMLAHAIRSIQEAVCITDAKDILLFVNDAFLETYGYERHEVLGKNIFELVRLPGNSAHDTAAIPPPNLIRRWEGELINRRKDGTTFPIHLSTSPIFDETGRTIALVGVTQDITERKRAITELQNAKEAAEAASRAKSEFLANMSHEIRTPMNGIIGMTELALDTELSTEQREYLKMVKLSADSLLGVINDVLDFSKVEAGRLELDPAEFNLQDAVDEVMKALAVRADQKGLELAYYLRPGVPERVVGDVGRLRQVLVNLVGNAIKFTERGEVIVRVEAETQTSDEVVLHFSVRDTGIGIPPGKETMIFESFTQADGSTTRKYGGTGLGLTISSQLVQMMGGEIWVESPVNLPSSYGTPGSMFHFTGTFGLPLDSVLTAHPPEKFDLEGLPVLVVDDNATNRRILEVQLTNWQMKPALVEGGRSALRAIKHAASAGAPFKLALLDFHMPEMDGLALAELIKSAPEGRDIRIIMMSSSVQQNQASPRDCSVDASLLKPVKAAELLSVIRVVLGADPHSQTQRRQAGRKSAYPSRVLVAEDSKINQELIRRLLEKWGHTALIAENGLEALSLFDSEMFDLVLMDLQMPEMNGFEVTAAIRQRERGAGTRIPIIALTAHALKGDRERCIGAGMDDYVSKPIDAGRLFGAVETAAIRRGSARSNCEIVPKALDLDGLVRNFDGDSNLVLTLARVFADSSLSQVEQIGDAIARGDAEALASGAHLLKGSVANFGARAAVDAAVQLEGIAKSGDLSIAGSAFATLEKEIDRLKRELQMFERASLL